MLHLANYCLLPYLEITIFYIIAVREPLDQNQNFTELQTEERSPLAMHPHFLYSNPNWLDLLPVIAISTHNLPEAA